MPATAEQSGTQGLGLSTTEMRTRTGVVPRGWETASQEHSATEQAAVCSEAGGRATV